MKAKLTILLLAVGLLPFLLLGLWGINTVRQGLGQEISNGLLRFAEAKEGEVYAYLDAIETRTLDFSSDGFIRNSLRDRDFEGLSRHLRVNKQPLDRSLAGILVMDLTGKVAAATDRQELGTNLTSHSEFFKVKETIFTAEMHKEDRFFGLKEGLLVSAPLTDHLTGRRLGVITNVFRIDKLYNILSGEYLLERGALTARGGQAGIEVYLVDKNKLMLVPPAAEASGTSLPLNLTVDTLPVHRALEEGKETIAVYKNYFNEEVLGAAMYIPARQWVLLVEQRTDLAFAAINRLYFAFSLIFLVLIVSVVFAAFRYARQFARPIEKLTAAVTEISQGKLDVVVEGTERKDELGDLARAFDRTLVSLKLAMREKQK